MFSNKEVARYYDLSEIHYRMFWNLNESKSLHYGYWDSTTKNFHEALLNINKVLSGRVKIDNSDKVLDAGCGVGGSSIWLAKEIGCNVTGITLSEKQMNKASLTAKQMGLDMLVKFQQRDFTSTGYKDGLFNVVWGIESICHANKKLDFLKEAYRLLAPGGRLILADFFKLKGLQGEDEGIIRRWAHGWAVPDFSVIEEFEDQMKEAGFKKIEISDATQAITPSAKRLYKSYFIGVIGAKLYALFNKPTQLSKDNVETAYLQYKGLKKNLWKYKIISAVK